MILKTNRIIKGDAIEEMNKLIEAGVKVDLILTDPPYGTTKCKWDTPLNLDEMWRCINKIKRSENVATLLFAQTPFDKILGVSNVKQLKYEWIWEKTQATGHLNSKKMPMKAHENILVFYEKLPYYNPQKTYGHKRKVSSSEHKRNSKKTDVYNMHENTSYDSTERFPRDVLKYATDKQKEALHPTQKPIELLKYFLLTYTKEGDTVLDFTCGSGSLGQACIETNRKFILIEKEEHYINITNERLNRQNY